MNKVYKVGDKIFRYSRYGKVIYGEITSIIDSEIFRVRGKGKQSSTWHVDHWSSISDLEVLK